MVTLENPPVSPEPGRRRTAKTAFDGIVAKKTSDGLRRIARWDSWDIPDDLDEDAVLSAVYDATDRMAASEILRQINEPSGIRPNAELLSLGELEVGTEVMFRVHHVMPTDGNMLVVAQRKAGKTVLALNLAQSLLLGSDFLGNYPVMPLSGSLAFLNYELSPQMFGAWSKHLRLPEDRFLVANMRGRANPFRDREARAHLGQAMRAQSVEALVIDPFSVAYSGMDANNPTEVRGWLTQLDDWFRGDVGGREIVLTAHAGWGAEDRARGASSLEDWPDSILTLRSSGRSQHRTLSVRGRDVGVDNVAVHMDPETRSLTAAARTPEQPLQTLAESCLNVISEQPGLNTEQVAVALRLRGIGFRKGEENQALRELAETGLVSVRQGARGARLHFPLSS
ncbi:AAA family ATPase [Knoellia sp. CPCC 206450]|uniref:AAA family ATPase n=1 Tax=Knoellia tibetensis TaxID=3404798 RepID=UPI003B43D32C